MWVYCVTKTCKRCIYEPDAKKQLNVKTKARSAFLNEITSAT